MRWMLAASLLWFCACPRPGLGDLRPDGRGEAPRPPPARVDPSADAALEETIRSADLLPKEKAAEAYERMRAAYPQTTAAQEATYRAGALRYELGQHQKAREAFQTLLFEDPVHPRAPEARRMLGYASLEVGAYKDAYQALAPLLESAEGAERERLAQAVQRAAAGAQLHDVALRLAVQRVDAAQSAQEQTAALAEVEALVESKTPVEDVAKVKAELSPSHPAWPLLAFKVVRVLYHLRDWDRLDGALREFLREAPTHPFAGQAQAMMERATRRGQVNPARVGVALPLTGKYQQVGEAVLRGIKLALKGSSLELVVKDTQGDVNLTAKAVEELAFDDQVIAVLGPLLSDDSRRAALVAEELQVPLLTLSRSEDVTEIGPYVFRNMLTPTAQARALADYAVGGLGFKTFGVLYPNIPFGVELANSFWDEVVARGGAMRAAESYQHDQTTFTSEVKKLVGRYYLEDRSDYLEKVREVQQSGQDAFRRRKALEKVRSNLPPVVDFEALLIPDTWQRVGLVAPALAVEDIITNACDARDLENIRKTTGKKDIKTVLLLGTSTWGSPVGRTGVPELVERGGKFVNCSVYVDGFFAESNRPATRRFVSSFKAAYPEVQPTLLDATGYDSALMFRQVSERAQPQTRDAFREALNTVTLEGATGATRFDAQRQAVKPLFFLSVGKDGIKEITPPGGARPES